MTSMKRIVFLVLVILMVGAVTAQAGKSVFAGVTLPQKAFGDRADNGLHGGFEITKGIVPALLSLGAQASVSRNAFDFGDNPALADMSASWYTGEVLGIAKVSIPITGVYAKVGVGFNHYRVTGDADYDSETHLAGAVGAGWNIMMLDLNVMYHIVKWNADDENPQSFEDLENLDDNYSYFTASVGWGF